MYFYNPFKPHIAKLTAANAFVIRRFGGFCWTYLDRENDFWWASKKEAIAYCVYFQPSDAAERCINYLKPKKPFAKVYAT